MDTRADKPGDRQSAPKENPFRATWHRFLAPIAFLSKGLNE